MQNERRSGAGEFYSSVNYITRKSRNIKRKRRWDGVPANEVAQQGRLRQFFVGSERLMPLRRVNLPRTTALRKEWPPQLVFGQARCVSQSIRRSATLREWQAAVEAAKPWFTTVGISPTGLCFLRRGQAPVSGLVQPGELVSWDRCDASSSGIAATAPPDRG
jgi:hypothetical protein